MFFGFLHRRTFQTGSFERFYIFQRHIKSPTHLVTKMSNASDSIEIRRCRALIGSCPGPQGPAGPGVAPLYASFLSNTTQNVTLINPVAITYSERTIGSINVNGTYPNSTIVIPTTGVYRVLFSAQCDSTAGTHFLEIFPVVNGNTVPNSNTRIRLSAAIESCLVVEYFLSFNANDELQLFMVGDNANARIVAITRGSGTPSIPNIPSIIVTIMRIA
jgi:hypothetical protein